MRLATFFGLAAILKSLTTYTLATVLILFATGLEKSAAAQTNSGQPDVARESFDGLKQSMTRHWPKNRLICFVFHGHSVPAGYFRTPTIRRFDSYPVLFHKALCEISPSAVIDVCTTAIGGKNSQGGSKRFANDVLTMNPDVVFTDYGLNDREIGVEAAEKARRSMINQELRKQVKIVSLTRTPDSREDIRETNSPLARHTRSIRGPGGEFGLPVVNSYGAFRQLVFDGSEVSSFLSQPNHPNRKGHDLVADLILELFR